MPLGAVHPITEEDIQGKIAVMAVISMKGAAFLMAMAGALAVTSAHDPVEVAPAPPFPLCQETIYRSIRVRSSELPDDFEEGTIVTHTHLQTWTARPAVRP